MTGYSNRIDTSALDGLRGLAALHVVVGHLVPNNFLALQPASQMPLFYLLSGFTLALSYGRRKEEDISFLKKIKSALKFYQNRFARTAPSFYLSNLLAFLVGNKSNYLPIVTKINLFSRCFFTATITNSWFIFFGNNTYAFNGASWTISTLTCMYFVFPWIISYLQSFSDASIARAIVVLYYIQLLPFFFAVCIWNTSVLDYLGDIIWKFNTIARNPMLRMPVFVMGILSGLQKIREEDEDNFTDQNLSKNFIHDILPWGIFYNKKCTKDLYQESKEIKWRWRVDRNSLFIILYLLVCIYAGKHYDRIQKSSNYSFVMTHSSQYFLVHLQVLIIRGLTSDGSSSYVSKLCKAGFTTFLGRISMAVYLYHMPVRVYVHKLLKTKETRWFLMLPYDILIAIVVGTLMTLLVDEPAKKLLQTKSRRFEANDNNQLSKKIEIIADP